MSVHAAWPERVQVHYYYNYARPLKRYGLCTSSLEKAGAPKNYVNKC